MADKQLSPAKASFQRTLASKPMTVFNSRLLHHLDNLVYRLSGKNTTLVGLVLRLPIITLTTTGAKSGQPRTLPLICIRDPQRPGVYALIASNWGKPNAPAWYYNLKATPRATGTIRGKMVDYTATEAAGEDYDRLWALAVNTYAGYGVYKVRASHRHIPIIVLTPVQAGF